MPQLRMTWEESKSRWRKTYKRKVFTSSKCNKSDREAEKKAWQEFVKFRAKIDQDTEIDKPHWEDYQTAISLRMELLKWLEREVELLKTDQNQNNNIMRQLAKGLTHGTRETLHVEDQDPAFDDDGTEVIDIMDGFTSNGQPALSRFLSQPLKMNEIGLDTETNESSPVALLEHDQSASHLLTVLFGSDSEQKQLKLKTANQQVKQLKNDLKYLNENLSRKNPPKLNDASTLPVNPLQGQPLKVINEWASRLSEQQKSEQANGILEHSETIGGNIERYLTSQRKRLEAGEITISTYSSHEQRVSQLNTYAGPKAIENFNEKLMSSYQEFLQEKVKQEEYSPQHAKNLLNAAKSFGSWLYEEGVIANPLKNVKRLKISVSAPKIKTFDKDTLKRLLDGSSERTRLYLLLMMNTGCTQKDISDLLQTEVDWENGYIERKRSKTKAQKNVPTVRYKLWDETWELLKKHRNQDSERVLLSQEGTELVRKNLRDDGKATPIDVIQLAVARVKKKLQITGRIKDIRKTVSSELNKHEEFSRYAQYFLAQAPTTVADRHYIIPDQMSFERAIIWLGNRYDHKTTLHNSSAFQPSEENPQMIETFTADTAGTIFRPSGGS